MHGDPVRRPVSRGRGRPAHTDSAETRRRILDAARRAINERGYSGATVHQIAIASGLSRTTVQNYFPSRERLYLTIAAEGSAVLAKCTVAVQSHAVFGAQLSALIGALKEQFQDRSHTAFLVRGRVEGYRYAELKVLREAGLNRLLTAMIEEAIGRGELAADTEVGPVADMLQSVMWGMGLYAGFIDTVADTGPLHELLDRVMSHGLLGAVGVRDSRDETLGDAPC